MNTSSPEKGSRCYLEDLFDPGLCVILEALLNDIGYVCLPYPEYPDPPEIGIGWFTYPGKRAIFYNPYHVEERGVAYSFPIFAHEIGHHNPEVEKFQKACEKVGAVYSNLFRKILPVGKIIQTLNNVSADIFLEERNAKGIYFPMMSKLNRRALAQDCLPKDEFEKYKDDLSPENFPWREAVPEDKNSFLFESFINGILLMAKFGLPPKGIFDENVQKALEEAYDHILTIKNVDKAYASLSQKVQAQVRIYQIVSKLVDKDYKNIEKSAKDPKSPTLVELMGKFEEMLDVFIVKMRPVSEEIKDDKDEVSPIVIKETSDINGDIAGLIKAALAGISDGISGIKADQLNVDKENLLSYLKYINRYQSYIERLTDILFEFLLKDRVLTEIGGQRDGFMVEPGMEALTYYNYIGGDLEPPTMIDQTTQVKPLSLEAALVQDTSGSMDEYKEGMYGFLATLIESIRQIHERVISEPNKYNWTPGDKMPASLELSVFADEPELIMPMSSTLDISTAIDKFNEMKKIGGGTSTHEVLNFQYDRLTANQDDQIVRVLTLVTDGQDEGPLLDRIVKKIVNDPRIYFLVVGIGPDEEVRQSILNVYKKHLTPLSRYRVFAQGFPKVSLAINSIISFFNMALETEKQKRDALLRGASVSGF